MSYSKIFIKVPDINTSFKSGRFNYSTPSTKRQNIALIQKVNKDYSTIINMWSKVYDIPVAVLVSFIATESGGRMLASNIYQATGLMQVTPTALYDVLKKWNREVKTPLPIETVNLVNQKVPELLKSKAYTPTIRSKILVNLQNDANFNIMAGTSVLRWLLERFSTVQTGGQLNKAMVGYNAGPFTRSISKGTTAILEPIDSTTLSTSRIVPQESRGYLLKMLGIDGFLSLIYKDKAI